MSPASYLAAPPRVATLRIAARAARRNPSGGPKTPWYDRSVPWWTWLALGVFLAGAVGGAAFLAAIVLRALRRTLETERRAGEAAGDLLARLQRLETRLTAAAEASAELDRRIAGLRRSVARVV